MPIAEFTIEPDDGTPVIHTGLRAALISNASEHNIKLKAVNLWNDKVHVAMEATEDKLGKFYEFVKNNDLRTKHVGGKYKVGDLKWHALHVADEYIDWNTYYAMITAEFTIKNNQALKRIEKAKAQKARYRLHPSDFAK